MGLPYIAMGCSLTLLTTTGHVRAPNGTARRCIRAGSERWNLPVLTPAGGNLEREHYGCGRTGADARRYNKMKVRGFMSISGL
jgi:hypothetical protein